MPTPFSDVPPPTMDDPTTDLTRSQANVTIMVAGSRKMADDLLTHYGVKVQGDVSIVIVTNVDDAMDAISKYVAATPWCIVPDGLTDGGVRDMIRANFGPVKTIAEALGVQNKGTAMRMWEM